MCHISDVTLLNLTLRPGQSIFEQVVFAARKAFVSGEYRTGHAFRSVRAPAAELKIHPNTAHKIVQQLIQEGWLATHPGIGTVVATPPEARLGEKKRLLQTEVEQLVVEAKRVGLDLADLVEAIEGQWDK